MGDLISRSALIEAITQHGKDIKSDVPMIEDIYQTAHKHIIDLVNIQPTAYDAEKVVEELEKRSWKSYSDVAKRNLLHLDDAIKTVRKGGV